MPDHDSTDAGAAPPPAILLQMMTGYWGSQALYVAAKLGIADLLADGPVDSAELATATGSDARSLHRVLRALASVGVFTEVIPGRFALTPLADLLRTGPPHSMRALAIMYAEEQYHAWGDILHSVRTGAPAFEQRYGSGYFDYLARHPASGQVFNEAMTGWTNQVAGAVATTYDFSPFGTVVDVAGGHGALLADILRRNPTMRGILFDLPLVAAGAARALRDAGLGERCDTVGGDFFTDALPTGDAYVLAQILHDWDDERSVAILEQCRRAMPDHGKLLVVELVLPPGDEPSFGKWLDLHMLALNSGRERTTAEYDALFRASGFALARVIPTPPGPSVVEALPI